MRLRSLLLLALPLASCNDIQNNHANDPQPSLLPVTGSAVQATTQLTAGHWEFNASLSSQDAAGVLVFTPTVTVPQRTWEHYDFNGRGRFAHTAPGPNDASATTTGTYRQVGSDVNLKWRQGRAVLHILSITSKQLRLTRTY